MMALGSPLIGLTSPKGVENTSAAVRLMDIAVSAKGPQQTRIGPTNAP